MCQAKIVDFLAGTDGRPKFHSSSRVRDTTSGGSVGDAHSSTRGSSLPNNNNNNKPEQEGILYHTSDSPYKTFPAMGFQIYTGGAPALLDHNSHARHPECDGYASLGYLDDYDATNTNTNASTMNHVWQCYLGHPNTTWDVGCQS